MLSLGAEIGNVGPNWQCDNQDVLRSFESFKDHMNAGISGMHKAVPYEARLQHYNSLETMIPSSVNLDPHVF